MEHAITAMAFVLFIVLVKKRGRKIDELTERLKSEMIISDKLRLELSKKSQSEEANEKNELPSTHADSMPHYVVYVDGLLKFTFNDYYYVAPLSRFGKNVYVVRSGKPIKWIGKGKQMYEVNAAQMNLEI